jgi:flagellar biosynthetic protein FlhB
MADDSAAEDRTEHASSRRLQHAQEEGNIAVSRDVSLVAAVAVGGWTLVLAAPGIRDSLVELVRQAAQTVGTGHPRDLAPAMTRPALLGLQVCLAVALAAALSFLVQTRGGFWPQLALPRFDRVIGGGRLGRMFRKDLPIDVGMTLVKTATLGWALWAAFRDGFLTLPRMVGINTTALLPALFGPLAGGLARIVAALVVVAGADLALTRFRFSKKMMMTKEEAKREYREEEGDPLIRSRRRRKHRDLAKGRVAVDVPRADVLLVNPTHVAVALRYRPEESRAPIVLAKGKGELAEIMRDLARSNGIPIVEDIPLARMLYKRVKVGKAIPADTFKAVAAILAFVYRVIGRNSAGASSAVSR